MKWFVVFAGTFFLAGCAQSVQLEPASTDDATTSACSSFVGALPVTLDGARRANTTPKSPTTAAWGPEFITLRCGVPTPAALNATSQLITINGVDWFSEKLTNGVMFTTVGRNANVEVVVPSSYAPEANVVTELSDLVSAELPQASSAT